MVSTKCQNSTSKRDILLSFESHVILLSNLVDFCSLSRVKQTWM